MKPKRQPSPYTRRGNRLHHLVAPEVGASIYVTERQLQILILLGGGATIAEIATRLHLLQQDVRNRLNRLAAATGLNRAKLAYLGTRLAARQEP